jgi:hypothetical protein
MKIVYEDHILNRIQRAVYDAELVNRRIGYIEVTVREANELSEYLHRRTRIMLNDSSFGLYTAADAGKVVGTFYGAEIRVELK